MKVRVGRLGAVVVYPRSRETVVVTDARLDEIERRILAIEAEIAFLNPGGGLAQVGRSAERQDAKRLGPKDEHAGDAKGGDAPKGN